MSLIDLVRRKKGLPKKVAILGPTGSGKTTFLEGFFNQLERSDVVRRKQVENTVDNTYVLLAGQKNIDSMTTVSMNQLSVKLVISKANRLYYSDPNEVIPPEECETELEISFIDNPGQERFLFMSEINIGGADAAIIVVDGSISVSIASLPKFLEVVRIEEERTKRELPKLVFVNKADLAQAGGYLGSETVLRLFQDLINKYKIILFETTNSNFVSFEVPLRTLIQFLTKKIKYKNY